MRTTFPRSTRIISNSLLRFAIYRTIKRVRSWNLVCGIAMLVQREGEKDREREREGGENEHCERQHYAKGRAYLESRG